MSRFKLVSNSLNKIIFSSHTNEFTRECHMDNPEVKVTSKLNDREKKQAALPIVVFGMEMVISADSVVCLYAVYRHVVRYFPFF